MKSNLILSNIKKYWRAWDSMPSYPYGPLLGTEPEVTPAECGPKTICRYMYMICMYIYIYMYRGENFSNIGEKIQSSGLIPQLFYF